MPRSDDPESGVAWLLRDYLESMPCRILAESAPSDSSTRAPYSVNCTALLDAIVMRSEASDQSCIDRDTRVELTSAIICAHTTWQDIITHAMPYVAGSSWMLLWSYDAPAVVSSAASILAMATGIVPDTRDLSFFAANRHTYDDVRKL
ncbi:uncharacterized protein AMSG_09666 [Thecamonas trahens ATCC 50062]|uniref:Uncharacterized protein n=1 Tax=Thecamonas trahens ATCC 50062 TaxID=461836 RepID=A0A0L0DP17_THETB|nr:hypothetical protein AMSG_09666 [Thecamonas trahens ATCC 50062]KNC54010.1 hypothetical protein AMSG_09666 [Thecamonas trahens ATCC 50062]|eukprot:XP_013754025.1 hypothetical protein AMSG_09666 [Thecamonas trahens ATCC 50062]